MKILTLNSRINSAETWGLQKRIRTRKENNKKAKILATALKKKRVMMMNGK